MAASLFAAWAGTAAGGAGIAAGLTMASLAITRRRFPQVFELSHRKFRPFGLGA